MKKESSTNLQKYSGIAEQMIKMSLDCPEITKMILDIIYGDEGEGNGNGITLYLMFNREFMNDVYRTFRIISRGL